MTALTRRDLLWGAALLGAAAVVGSGSATVSPLSRLTTAGAPRLSLGFMDEVVTTPAQIRRGATIVPASGLRRALGAGEGAAVRVGGVTGMSTAAGSVQLDALLPHPDRMALEPLRFAAFTARGGDVPTVSLPTTIAAALLEDPGLGFELTTTTPDGAATTHAVFTDAAGDGNPSLRPGTYLLSLAPDRWESATRAPAVDDPAWADLASIMVSVVPTG